MKLKFENHAPPNATIDFPRRSHKGGPILFARPMSFIDLL